MIKAAALVISIVAAMAVVKDGRALQHAGILSSCRDVAAPRGHAGYWVACRPGKLEGRPNLKRNACDSQGVAANVEFWRCPARIGSGTAEVRQP